MKSKWIFLGFVVLSSPFTAMAAGTILLDGKVRSFSPQTIELNDGKRIYLIQREKLTSADDAKLKAIKTGQAIELQVPFGAVLSAKRIK